jgi:hypothetical protein
MVRSLTRNASAISAADSKVRLDRLSATWASIGRAGCAQANISSSRSSETASASATRSGGSRAASLAISRSFSASTSARLARSMARFLAVVMSQAMGLPGTPSTGHRTRARAKAS